MKQPFSIEKNTKRIYSICKPPSPNQPHLHPHRHFDIIKHFEEEGNAYHTLNFYGEVDFYLFSSEDLNNKLLTKQEEYGLICNKNSIEMEIYYNDELKGSFLFALDNPLDTNNLQCLIEKRSVNLYYVACIDEKYVCSGVKTLVLPAFLSYDVQRYLEGKKTLLLPDFSASFISDNLITEDVIMRKAWGFYLDFTSLVNRIGNVEDAEEIVTRHILHGISCLQKSKRAKIKKDMLFFWVGRKVDLNYELIPREYYCTYVSGNYLQSDSAKDYPYKIMEETFQDIPEFFEVNWVSPLAEEAVPLSVVHNNQCYRMNLSEKFYSMSNNLFKNNFLPTPEYQSFYHKIVETYIIESSKPKIYNLLDRIKKKG
ncbi:MAG: hypothetical protein CVU87_10295 [Firmicutes bacterium HGW-Firmicutes-12]|jgi:hypothetical protein|nr:MAG: hypothetical protein CVU87_10295 [Firmicutes bacterium HGW-Firmicutes-12]